MKTVTFRILLLCHDLCDFKTVFNGMPSLGQELRLSIYQVVHWILGGQWFTRFFHEVAYLPVKKGADQNYIPLSKTAQLHVLYVWYTTAETTLDLTKVLWCQKGVILVYVKVYVSLLDLFWILKASKSVVKNMIQSNQNPAK